MARRRIYVGAVPGPADEEERKYGSASVTAVISPPSAYGACKNNYNHKHHDQKPDDNKAAVALRLGFGHSSADGGAHAIVICVPAGELRKQGFDCLVIVTPVKVVPEVIVQVFAGYLVRKDVIYAGAGGQPALAFADSGKQKHTVVLLSVADTPVIEKPVRILVGGVTVKVIYKDYGDLSACTFSHEPLVRLDDHLLR